MTREEAIEYWEQFKSEIDDLLPDTCGACKKALVEQREVVEFTIAALREQMDWISVKERLPEAGTYVLVCCTMKVTDNVRYEKAIVMAFVCEDGFIDVEFDKAITAGVTHWMPLPELPKEGKQ